MEKFWIGTDDGVFRWAGSEGTRAGVPAVLAHGDILSANSRSRFEISGWALVAVSIEISATSGGACGRMLTFRPSALSARYFKTGKEMCGPEVPTVSIDLGVSAFVTFTASEGLTSESNGSLYVDTNHRIWVAPLDGGLQLMDGNAIQSDNRRRLKP